MIEEYFTTSKVTTTSAFELFEKLARDWGNSEHIYLHSKSFRETSILYHAAKHHGFTITHFILPPMQVINGTLCMGCCSEHSHKSIYS